MQITANLEQDGSAVLKLVTNSSKSNFVVKGATKLAGDLQTILNSPNNEEIDRHYRIVTSEMGVVVETDKGKFDLPWRHISTVIEGLRA